MAQGWCIVPYVPFPVRGIVGRAYRTNYVAATYNDLIAADGGDWRDVDLPKGNALVKVRASVTTLQTIAADPQVTRLPKDLIDASLSDLTQAQKTVIQTKLNNLGYTNAEIRAALGTDIGLNTLRDVLRFAASRYTAFRPDSTQADVVLYDLGDVSVNTSDSVVSGLDIAV